MAARITCPNCQTEFEPTDALRDELKRQLNHEMQIWRKGKEDEYSQKAHNLQQAKEALEREKRLHEEQFLARLNAEAAKREVDIRQELQKRLASDFDEKIKALETAKMEREEQLAQARKRELDLLKKEEILQQREQTMELEMKRTILQERERLADQLKKQNEEREKQQQMEFQLRQKEWEMKFEQQQKALEEARKKAEQGSMQLQGEAQELVLEEMLAQAFPFDTVSEVGKGRKGADCLLKVRNGFGQECGTIIFESKRTKDFNDDWVEKLNSDARAIGADAAVIVTRAMPKGIQSFGEKNGVWICTFSEVQALTAVLRNGIIKVYQANKNQENKGDKMHMLYTYLTGNEFAQQWKAIREGFSAMRNSIQKERDQMERIWKAREKQLEKVLLNAAHIRGSIEGIAGMESVDLELQPDTHLLID